MPVSDSQLLRDMSRLALERTRKVMGDIGQLLEDEYQYGALLTTVSIDLARGSAAYMASATGQTERKALLMVINSMLGVFDVTPEEMEMLTKRRAAK